MPVASTPDNSPWPSADRLQAQAISFSGSDGFPGFVAADHTEMQMPYQDLSLAASSAPKSKTPGAFNQIADVAMRGAGKAWSEGGVLGLDPRTILDHQQPGGAFHGPVGVIGQTLFTPMFAAGDALLRGGNALYHGGAAAAGQAAQAFGQSQGMGRRLERDILMMPEALAGRFGRAPSAFAVSRPAVERIGRTAKRELANPGWRGFVKAPDGSFDLGFLDMDDGLGALSIRIRKGHHDKKTEGGIGLKHVEVRHGEQIKKIRDANGKPIFRSVPEYVNYVSRNWTEIRDNGRGRPVLVVRIPELTKSRHEQQSMILELSKPLRGNFYDLMTAGPYKNRSLAKLKLIKER